MPNIDWKSSLEGEPLADIYGFTHMITARRLYEDGANIEEHQKWHSMSDELILLICAGCKARCIEIFGGDVAILDEFSRTYAELLSLGSLKAFFINQNDGDGFVQKYNIESRFLLAQHKMNEIRKALFDIYIKPIDAATWMSSTNKGKMLLPQSLLGFLGGGTEQEILSTMDCPANTVKVLPPTAEEEMIPDNPLDYGKMLLQKGYSPSERISMLKAKFPRLKTYELGAYARGYILDAYNKDACTQWYKDNK